MDILYGVKGSGMATYMLNKMVEEEQECINNKNCYYDYKNNNPTLNVNCWRYCRGN